MEPWTLTSKCYAWARSWTWKPRKKETSGVSIWQGHSVIYFDQPGYSWRWGSLGSMGRRKEGKGDLGIAAGHGHL